MAVDLLGGDTAPTAVLAGVVAAAARPDVEVLAVGPADVAAALPQGVRVVPAADRVGMHEDPTRAVRARPQSSIAVAARLVRDGAADALFSAGSTGATMAAAVFLLGRLDGMGRPALAAVLPSRRGPVVLLDVGANASATDEHLLAFARAGVVYARMRLGLAEPRVGLLSLGAEAGKGDNLRRRVDRRLSAVCADAAARYVGNVEGHSVPLGEPADVVVTDGFTGNVLLKGIEGTVDAVGEATVPPPGEGARPAEHPALLRRFQAEASGGAILLGVRGVVVVGHGAAGPAAIAAGIKLAADAAIDGLPTRLSAALSAPPPPHSPPIPGPVSGRHG